MSKHTPGPWKWLDVQNYKGYAKAEELFGTNGTNILEVQEYCFYARREDMVLIAAAPELLEACEAAFKVLDWGADPQIAYLAYDLLGAAIAKAKGEK